MRSAISKILTLTLVILISAAITSVDAQKKPGKGKDGKGEAGPTNPTPVDTITSKPKNKEGKTIGSCDSAKGCKTLKAACEHKDVGGEFKPSNPDGSAGVCVKKGSKDSPAGASNLAATGNVSEDATCFDHALCQKLKTACRAPSKWKQDYPNVPHGTCVD